MNNQIICPHCKKPFLPEEGMRHQLDEERQKVRKTEVDKLRKEIEQETALKLKDKENETSELKDQNKKLQEQMLDTNKILRQLQKQLAEKDLEVQKKIQQEEEKIRLETRKKAEEENNLRNREKDKKLEDALKMADEYRRKFEQGSQQTQGEVLEEYLENMLKNTFLYDDVQPVPKGIRGADVVQIVKNKFRQVGGKIVWESKRTKAWSNDWITKLISDKHNVKADEAVLVTNVLPNQIKGFGNYEGVWISNYESIIGVATVLRTFLLQVAIAKANNKSDRSDVKEQLYEYVQSTEFRNRFEAISGAFKARQEEIDIEKKWFTKKWAREEKTIATLLSNNSGLKGELESITGIKMDDDALVLESGDEVS